MDVFLEIVLELFLEVYLSIGEILVPEKKFKKWQENLLKVLSAVVCVVILCCIGIGIAFLTEGVARLYNSGVVLVSVGAALLAVQIVLTVIAIVHDCKKRKSEPKNVEP